MASELLDRVAKEIAAEIMELTASQRATFQFPDDANGDTIERARSAARLVIAAMREPTPEIVSAHHIVPEDNDFYDRAAANWRNLIDVILA